MNLIKYPWETPICMRPANQTFQFFIFFRFPIVLNFKFFNFFQLLSNFPGFSIFQFFNFFQFFNYFQIFYCFRFFNSFKFFSTFNFFEVFFGIFKLQSFQVQITKFWLQEYFFQPNRALFLPSLYMHKISWKNSTFFHDCIILIFDSSSIRGINQIIITYRVLSVSSNEWIILTCDLRADFVTELRVLCSLHVNQPLTCISRRRMHKGAQRCHFWQENYD